MADANKDEIDKCKQVARTSINNGDTEKAIRFLTKAKRMCPEDGSIDDLIAQAQSGGGGGPGGGGGGGSSPADEPRRGSSTASGQQPPGQRAAPASNSGTRTNKNGETYNSEQMQLVQRILRTKDYYDMLGLSRDANEDAVKKTYKKLALKLHPDKNKAPGAEEAFKKVSRAVQCLTDRDKKDVYDRYGDEDRIPQNQRSNQDFMTPEDLFAAFFGGGVFQQQGHGQRQQQQQRQDGDRDPAAAQRAHIFQMLPVVLLVLVTLFSNFASRDGGARFSFTASGQYTNERTSPTVGVNYYVTDDFDNHYRDGTKSHSEFERQVEIYYVRNLHSECDYQEKVMHKKVMIAKRRGSKEDLESARNHPRPACKELERVKRRHGGIYRSAVYVGY